MKKYSPSLDFDVKLDIIQRAVGYVCITIDNIPHLCFNRSEFLAMKSSIEDDYFTITILFKTGGELKLEYEEFKLFELIATKIRDEIV